MLSFAMRRRIYGILRGTGPAQGMLLMGFATICFVVMQSMIRLVGHDVPPFEVAFFRNLFGMMALTPLFLRHGFRPFHTKRLHLHALRGTIQGCSMLAFFTALTLIPLSQSTALSFSAPLFATILAVVLLGEQVRLRRIVALVCGFIGVLIVVRPGVDEVSLGTLLALTASLGWGSAIAVIKMMSSTESSTTQTAYMGVFMTPITFVGALFVWSWPSLEQLLLLIAIGSIGTIGHLAFAQSFRKADSTAILPLDFLRLLWASILGYLIFSEVPDVYAWIGGAVIFTSATYIAFREARLARDARRASRG